MMALVKAQCADIVVLDPNTVREKATFTDPARLAECFRHVIVNGTPIIEEGERLGDARPGKEVRRSAK